MPCTWACLHWASGVLAIVACGISAFLLSADLNSSPWYASTPGALIRDATWVSRRGRLCSLYEHASVCTRRCYLALLFFSRFHYAKKTMCTAAGHLFDVGLFLVANEMWTNRELKLNGHRKTKVFSCFPFFIPHHSPTKRKYISPCLSAGTVRRSLNTLLKLTNTEILKAWKALVIKWKEHWNSC